MLRTTLLSCLILCLNVATAPILFCEPDHNPLSSNSHDRTKSQKEIHSLEKGSPLEVEMAVGDVHRYKVTLESGQYLQLMVEQKGIEVTLALTGPDSTAIAEQRSAYGRQGPLSFSVIASATADYIFEVRAAEKYAPAGRYEIRIEALREPTRTDASRVAAERAFREARALRAQGVEDAQLKALDKYKESLRQWREAGDRRAEAIALQSIGILYRIMGELQHSIEYYGQALALQKASNDRRGEGFTLNFIGLAHALRGEFGQAEQYYNQALTLWQSEDDKLNVAETYNRMGGVYDGLGELIKAESYYRQSLELRREVKHFIGEGQSLNNIGEVLDKRGESQNALDYYGRALSIFEQANDIKSRAKVLSNIGYIYASLGDRKKALQYLEQARSIYEKAYSPLEEAATLIVIGNVHASSDTNMALAYYRQALAIQTKLDNKWGAAYTMISVGQLQVSLGDRQGGLKYYEQAFDIFGHLEDKQGRASALDKIADVFVSMDQGQRARDYYDKALQLWREVGDRRGEATTLYGIARLERDRGNLFDALKNSEAAINIIESLRSKVGSQQLRIVYLASVQDYYDLNIDTRMRLHKSGSSDEHQALALNACERSRARGLLELLNEMHVEINRKVDTQLLARESLLRQEINIKEQARINLLNRKHTAREAEISERELSELIDRDQSLLAEIKIKNPAYAALTQPQPLTLQEIQQQVLDPDTVLLEYALGDRRSYLWAVTQDSIASFELPNRKQIEDQAIHVYELLTTRQFVEGTPKQQQEQIARADAAYWPQAMRLSKMLLGDVASQLGAKRLLVVTEGMLQYIPFAALPVPDGKTSGANPLAATPHPLILDHEIVTLPSASVLGLLRREIKGRNPAAKTVAVLADPVFDKNDERVRTSNKNLTGREARPYSGVEFSRAIKDVGIIRDGLNLQRLRATEREARAIQSAASPQDSFEALGFKASLETAMNADLRQYRIVHFATHGVLDNQRPELSGIVLSLINEQGEAQNGFLRLHDIYNLNLPAELVVLSACSTGLGKEIRGEGLVGLTRGFMYAGAARVIASLWKVKDTSTAVFMGRFYQAMLARKLPPAAALRMAQVEMLKHAAFKSPYFWAAFVLQGEWK